MQTNSLAYKKVLTARRNTPWGKHIKINYYVIVACYYFGVTATVQSLIHIALVFIQHTVVKIGIHLLSIELHNKIHAFNKSIHI